MKPDWKDAPEWVQWIAMDGNGDWMGYELEPVWKSNGGWWRCHRDAKRAAYLFGEHGKDSDFNRFPEAHKTLERRP